MATNSFSIYSRYISEILSNTFEQKKITTLHFNKDFSHEKMYWNTHLTYKIITTPRETQKFASAMAQRKFSSAKLVSFPFAFISFPCECFDIPRCEPIYWLLNGFETCVKIKIPCWKTQHTGILILIFHIFQAFHCFTV